MMATVLTEEPECFGFTSAASEGAGVAERKVAWLGVGSKISEAVGNESSEMNIGQPLRKVSHHLNYPIP